jgi:putative Holliday junction resolvase
MQTRFLAIDYGKKRIGLSFADELYLAYPLPPILSIQITERLKHITSTVNIYKVQAFVVGYPLQLDGTVGSRAQEVDVFLTHLVTAFQLPIYKQDERFSTLQAESDLNRGRSLRLDVKKLRAQRTSGVVDSRAATIILQTFLDERVDYKL